MIPLSALPLSTMTLSGVPDGAGGARVEWTITPAAGVHEVEVTIPPQSVVVGARATGAASVSTEEGRFLKVKGEGPVTLIVLADPLDGGGFVVSGTRVALTEARWSGAPITPVALAEDHWRVGFPLPVEAPTARWGAVQVGDQHVVRAALDLPDPLAPVPTDAAVVFLLDRSCSQSSRGIARQLAVIDAHVKALPAARYGLVSWDRTAEAAWPGLLAGADVRLPPAPEPRNGTRPQEAWAQALALLAAETGERRIVFLSDGLLPPSVNAAALGEAAPDEIRVHVVRTSGVPDTGAIWVAAPDLATGSLVQQGVSGQAVVLESFPDAAALVARNLVRPVQWDQVAWVFGSEEVEIGTVGEGGRARTTWVSPGLPRSVEVRGAAWSDEVKLTAARSAALDRLAEAAVWNALDQWPMDVMEGLGKAASLVNPWRQLEVGPNGGDAHWAPHVPHPAEMGFGGASGSGRGPAAEAWTRVDPTRVKVDLSACRATGSVEVRIWTSYREVADVVVQAADPTVAKCVEDRVFALSLGPEWKEPRATTTWAFRP